VVVGPNMQVLNLAVAMQNASAMKMTNVVALIKRHIFIMFT
jgi:hypothetical protein